VPADPDLPRIHTRHYQVDSYVDGPSRLRLRGTIRDIKPPGIYIADDPEPLTVHHMIVDLVVQAPQMEIVDAEVVFETHPHSSCVKIIDHYQKLVGLSIARGFTHRVRELFGGPRGCTHTTMLLQAMAPVAIQSVWSLAAADQKAAAGTGEPVEAPRRISAEERRERALRYNINSCHVWAEENEHVQGILAADTEQEMEPPLWIIERLEKLGRDPDSWREVMGRS